MADPVIDHLTAHGFLRTRKIMLNNFLGGLAWGFGSVIGATLFLVIFLGLLRSFNFLPGIGGLETEINNALPRKVPAVLDKDR